MMKDQSHMTEKIISLTLDIISLLIGERCTVVKETSFEGLLQGLYPPRSANHKLSMAPSPAFPTLEEDYKQKILEVINQVLHLLTGELPIRCQDVAVYLSMEERQYLEEHKELYTAAMMEDHLPSPDGSLEGFPHVIASMAPTQEDQEIPHHGQNGNGSIIPAPGRIKEEEGWELHKAAMTEDAGGASRRISAGRCPLYLPDPIQEMPRIGGDGPVGEVSGDSGPDADSHSHSLSLSTLGLIQGQNDGWVNIKVEEEDETYVRAEEGCAEARMMAEQPPDIGPDCKSEDSYGEIVILPNGRPQVPGGESSPEWFIDRWKPNDTDKGETPFQCPDCKKYFKSKLTLKKHSKLHLDIKTCYCPECGDFFNDRKQLGEHQKLHKGEWAFSCSQCNKSFVDESKLEAHQKFHASKNIHICSECGKWFTEKVTLLAHQRHHTGDKPYTCSECGENFAEKSELISHEGLHAGGKPYCCSECGMTFAWISNLIEHQQQGHQQQGHEPKQDFMLEALPEKLKPGLGRLPNAEEKPRHGKLLTCSTCDKKFADKSQLMAHRRTHLSQSQKPHSCSECGESFVYKAELDVHVRSHKGQKVYSCFECGNSYVFKSQLRKHWRIHTGEKRHACSECDRSFIWKSELELHMKRHRGEKPFSCSECGKRFIVKSKLKDHQKTHTKEKPFQCSDCGQRFLYKSHLTSHCDAHHADLPSSSSRWA